MISKEYINSVKGLFDEIKKDNKKAHVSIVLVVDNEEYMIVNDVKDVKITKTNRKATP